MIQHIFFAILLDFKIKLISLASVSCIVGSLDLHTECSTKFKHIKEFLFQHYKLARALQLKLGLTVCPDCQWDHAKTAKADVSL